MKWFNKWFEKKCRKALEKSHTVESDECSPRYAKANATRPMLVGGNQHYTGLSGNGIHFTLYSANGGTVVELVNYDPMADRRNVTLYVISSDKDLGQELAHVITLEALRR